MGRFLLRRLAFAAVLVFVVSSASLILVYLAPGDFVTESLGVHASAESIDCMPASFDDWMTCAVCTIAAKGSVPGTTISSACFPAFSARFTTLPPAVLSAGAAPWVQKKTERRFKA